MKVVGFNFSKMYAEKLPNFKRSTVSTNIEFVNVEKIETDIFGEQEALNVSFKYSLNFVLAEGKKEEKQGEVLFEGSISITMSKEEAKNVLKLWKKKQVPDNMKVPLFNFILQKCSLRAAQMEEEVGLPVHIPMPKISSQQPVSQEEA